MKRKTVLVLGIILLGMILVFPGINNARKVPLVSPVVKIVSTTEPTPTASVGAVLALALPATRSATPSATPTRKPTPKPTPTPKPQPKFSSEEIYQFTEKYGILYSVDPNVLRHIALCESGFNPAAKNYIYAGLYQFNPRTWQTYRSLMGWDPDPDIRYHAEEAVKTTAYALSRGARLWPNCYPNGK